MAVSALTGRPGIVYDEGLARATPCDCIALGLDEHACFSKGIKGKLSDGQEALFCNPRVTRDSSPAQKALMDVWDHCGNEVQRLPEGERLSAYYACIDREKKARGISEVGYGT